MKKLILLSFLVVLLSACQEDEEFIPPDSIIEKEIPFDEIHFILPASDNGYLFAGIDNLKITFLKTDKYLNTKWINSGYSWGNINLGSGWGSSHYQITIKAIFQNENRNYVCVGSTFEGGDVVWNNTHFITLNQNGKEVGIKTVKNIDVYTVLPTYDNSYFLQGIYELKKLNKNFGTEWNKNYQRIDKMAVASIVLPDGQFVITGRSNYEVFLQKLDKEGNELWTKGGSYNAMPNQDGGFALSGLTDGGFLIAGRTLKRLDVSPYHQTDCFVIRTDSEGDTVWTRKFGLETDDWLEDIICTHRNDYIIQGQKGHPGDEDQQAFLLKINGSGEIVDSIYSSQLQRVIYDQNGYFIKALKNSEGRIVIQKIPQSMLFD
ncbi:MAG: hypothetical protein JXR31_00690 [Prolixibacteraceae bacterium]|nr:hypothetical protein [Prolixibacteraceae bacterium]